ncbi:hypothetical protein HFO56_24580 [Rhizobium laguerreae]|uniref:hypothetical protein n=1 Tax=Rhizobium laguerreae TaxID=1076926 RepID=UPI001C91D8FC|nr:hypothetical protein [Rhizobium laguerreae]MBY3155507.1 hypothetical protein [Rhizobium laguerreae]MBY3433826.1 hypothetical protein [Rhizobium laguerreae]
MPATFENSAPRARSYDDLAITREDCVSIIECNPSHIRFLPRRMLDNGLAVLALRLGARPEEIPAL